MSLMGHPSFALVYAGAFALYHREGCLSHCKFIGYFRFVEILILGY